MAMSEKAILSYLKKAFPDAIIDLKPLVDDGDHYALTITSSAFNDLSRIKQHQLVYKSLDGRMGGALHALSITTRSTKGL
jgi:stress-induced morphogen